MDESRLQVEALAGRARTGLWAERAPPDGRSVSVRQARSGVVGDAEVRRELAREARVLALLGPHEAVLGLLADESEREPPRLVLEGGDLVPLARVLATGAPVLGAEAALALVLPLADALGEAHARGIVHGSVTPASVLVTSRGVPKLVLWADARAPGVDTEVERDASLIDPGWLAPEVLMGEPPGPAADVFALGLLFAIAATGRHPLQEAVEDAGSPARRGLGADAELARGGLGSSVPAPLARVVARALAKHPSERFESASALAAALLEASHPPDRASLASALARRGLGAAPRVRAQQVAPRAARRGPGPLPFLVVLAGLLFWGGAVELAAGDRSPVSGGGPSLAASGQLRILAQPWAHVSLDGAPLDTTPIGAPISVSPGRHVVDFLHPQAPKAQRVVEVRPGQTVVIDVILDVPAPIVDAGTDASP